jgi:hypothetical protein
MAMIPYFFITSVNALLGCWLGTVLTCAVIRWIIGHSAPISLYKMSFINSLIGLLLVITISLTFYEGVFQTALLSTAAGFVAGLLAGSLIGKALLPFT